MFYLDVLRSGVGLILMLVWRALEQVWPWGPPALCVYSHHHVSTHHIPDGRGPRWWIYLNDTLTQEHPNAMRIKGYEVFWPKTLVKSEANLSSAFIDISQWYHPLTLQQICRYYIQSTITLKKIYILLVNNSEGIKVMSIAHDTRILMSFNVVNYTETLLKKHIIWSQHGNFK